MAKKHRSVQGKNTSVISLCLLTAAFFFLCCLNGDPAAKYMAMGLLPLCIVFAAARFDFLKERFSSPILLLFAVTLMGCISALYAIWGDFALRGAVCLVVSVCAPLLVLLLNTKKVNPMRRLATVLAAAAAVMSLVSIDLISTKLLSSPVMAILRVCSDHYKTLDPVEAGVRINGLIGMPNVFAGCSGIGTLLSLGLAHTAEQPKERRLHLCLLFLSALAFVLTFSMGATAALALGFIVLLVLERRKTRLQLFLLMAKTLIVVLLAVVPISVTSLQEMGFQPIPLLCTAAGAGLLCLADRFFLPTLAQKLQERKKLVALCLAALGILAAGALTAALLWVGPARLAPGETLRRAVYPAAGEYVLTAQTEGEVSVTVRSQTEQEAMMHRSSTLYEGSLANASFTVPEGSMVVWTEFTAKADCTLADALLHGQDKTHTVPLQYKLLPNFIANRLQGLRANENAMQRTVFFRDGLKVFAQSPIVGQGLGAFETAFSQVQEYYYETKYVHNHYIQTLLETGVVGLCLFVGLLVSSAVVLLRARKREGALPLIPTLGGLLLFMTVHAGVEVVFSVGYYLPLAFGVFWLIGLCGERKKTVLRKGALLSFGACFLVFGILLAGNLHAKNLTKNRASYEAYEKAVKLDVFDWASYANSYLRSATGTEVPAKVEETCRKYALRLEKVQNRWVQFRLTHYYLQQGQVEKAMETALRHAKYNASSGEKWNELFALLAQYQSSDPAFRAGVSALNEFLQNWDAENLGDIELTEASRAFLADTLK